MSTDPGPGAPTPQLSRPRLSRRLESVKRVVIGKPLGTERLIHERLGKPTALAVFASDNLSSAAYASEEILRVLLKPSAAVGIATAVAFGLVVPITLALLGVLAILLFSYRQTIKAYPQAGGAYLVTRDNFGVLPAQVAGVALLTDYVLTVSVSVAAGTAALTSAYPGLYPLRVPISLAFIALITFGNLRGVREAGRIFAAPTYFFVGMMGVLLGFSFFRLVTGSAHPVASFPLGHSSETAAASLFLILHAFSSGGAAVTGVEAISNGVPAFREPQWRNAITTLMWMGSLLGAMFLGLSIMAAKLHVVPDPSEKVTVLAQVGRAAFGASGGGKVAFYLLQAATMLILVLAANTSFADFPRLASFHAGDHFLPRQLTRYGDRLVFSNGIMALAGLASVLVIVFKASVTKLIPLYAIGVFTSFTFSQAGMTRHHLREKEPGWRRGMLINATGALVTAVMTVIIAATKFLDGAWVVLVTTPLILAGLLRVNKHYRDAARILRDPRRKPPLDFPRQRVIIPVGDPGLDDRYALAYAQRVFPTEIRAVHFVEPGEAPGSLLDHGSQCGEVREVKRGTGNLVEDLRGYVRSIREEIEPGEVLNVVIPETVNRVGLPYILERRKTQSLKAALLAEPDVVITNVTHHQGYEALEPGEHASRWRGASEGWRHVAVLLVGGVHNATLSGLRYARSLLPDELHCIHIEVDKHAAEEVAEEWKSAVARTPLEMLQSPYRQVTGPIFEQVRQILDKQPRTFVTIVLPEFIVGTWWHNALHNQTALILKRAFLFEPSVVVSAVPYRLEDLPEEVLAGIAPAAGRD